MLKIAFFFIINLQLAPELIVDRFITFQNEGHFYIITEEDIYKTDDGQSYSVYKHNAHFPHFNFNFLKVDILISYFSAYSFAVFPFSYSSQTFLILIFWDIFLSFLNFNIYIFIFYFIF